MQPVHLHPMLCSGHGCHPPRLNAEGDSYLVVNGKISHNVGHSWQPHPCTCCKGQPKHGANLAAGSGYLLINNRWCGRKGDPVSCGSVAQESDEYLLLD